MSRLDLSAFSHEQGAVLLYNYMNSFFLLSFGAPVNQTSKTNRFISDTETLWVIQKWKANLVGKSLRVPY